MVETNNQNPIKGLGNKPNCEFVHDGVNLGIALMTPPLPTVWANLYSSWNLAFVSGGLSLPPIPMAAAKLLAPVVLRTYQEVDPGLYLAPRVIGLYIALQYNVLAQPSHYQVLMADGKLRNHSDWRIKMKESANLLGEVSQVAGRQFHARFFKFWVASVGNTCVRPQHVRIHTHARTHTHAHTRTHIHTHGHKRMHAPRT